MRAFRLCLRARASQLPSPQKRDNTSFKSLAPPSKIMSDLIGTIDSMVVGRKHYPNCEFFLKRRMRKGVKERGRHLLISFFERRAWQAGDASSSSLGRRRRRLRRRSTSKDSGRLIRRRRHDVDDVVVRRPPTPPPPQPPPVTTVTVAALGAAG